MRRRMPKGWVARVAVVVAVIYCVLGGWRLLNGLGLEGAVLGPIEDVQMAVKCPDQPRAILRYIDRTGAEELLRGLFGSDLKGDDLREAYCEHYGSSLNDGS